VIGYLFAWANILPTSLANTREDVVKIRSGHVAFTKWKGRDMNKAELIEIAAKEADISKAAAGKALDALISAVVKAVSKGDTVTLVGFGTFKSSKRAARTGKNPQTGATIKIPATTVPKFSAGAGFKSAVAGKKKK
jgi:DNA-binding protein HU-beta